MSKILPIVIVILGLAIGAGAGWVLHPQPEPIAAENEQEGAPETESPPEESAEDPTRDYVKLNNQFIIPVVKDGKVSALVVMSLNIEVTAGMREQVYTREPKVRDALLSTLFDHANFGGFDGAFTQASPMNALRRSLKQAAQSVLGDVVHDVLVIDIVRQDIS